MYELIIIGGGPAGMAAAVYAARKLINTVLVSGVSGNRRTGPTAWRTTWVTSLSREMS